MAGSVEKCLERFRKTLRDGAPYEAQQMVKTMFHRLRSRKRLEESRELLSAAAREQLNQKQARCGAELALLLVDAYVEDSVPADDESALEQFLQILRLFPEDKAFADDHNSVAKAALKWARSGDASSRSIERLHTELGHYLWHTRRMQGVQAATSHLARGNDMQTFAECLHGIAKEGDSAETDLVLVRAVLQLLTVPGKDPERQRDDFNKLYLLFMVLHPALPVDLPLLQFLDLLEEALNRESLQLFRLLRREYQPSLSRDTSLEASLDAIEAIHFNVRSSAGGYDGLLSNMMRMLTAA